MTPPLEELRTDDAQVCATYLWPPMFGIPQRLHMQDSRLSLLPTFIIHTYTYCCSSVDVRELCNARRFFPHAHGESAEFAAHRLRGDVELEVATAR
eukprot:281308-Pleurochrysis_carterae.AAC.1